DLDGKVAAGQYAYTLVRGELIDNSSYRLADVEEALRWWNRRGHHVGKNRHDGQIHFRADEVERYGERVVDAKLIGKRKVDAHFWRQLKHALRHVDFDLSTIGRDAKGTHLMRKGPFRSRRLADQKRRHVVHEKLIEMVAGDH